MFAYSFLSQVQLLLSATNENASLLNIIVSIRDTYDCVTEFNIPPVHIAPDRTQVDILMTNSQNVTNNFLAQMLEIGNQNMVGQVVTLLSEQLNQMNDQAVKDALARK